jgi:hypothetical protein
METVITEEPLNKPRVDTLTITREQLARVWDEQLAQSPIFGLGSSRYSMIFERFCEELGFKGERRWDDYLLGRQR